MPDVTVAFQGEPGAFSEEAALAMLGDVRALGFPVFDDVALAAESRDATYGLLPCENTISGAITRTYDLLYDHRRLRVVGETTHRIEQCLIGTPGSNLDGLATVLSHPVALEQCRSLFRSHPHLQPVAAVDTAGSVRAIVENGDPSVAAIGPELAAQRYGAVVLRRGVQDDEQNYTRFFLISAGEPPPQRSGRICLAMNLPHTPGSLYRALGRFAHKGLNLRSLVARPLRGKPFEYTFYLEIENASDCDLSGLPDAIVLGEY